MRGALLRASRERPGCSSRLIDLLPVWSSGLYTKPQPGSLSAPSDELIASESGSVSAGEVHHSVDISRAEGDK